MIVIFMEEVIDLYFDQALPTKRRLRMMPG